MVLSTGIRNKYKQLVHPRKILITKPNPEIRNIQNILRFKLNPEKFCASKIGYYNILLNQIVVLKLTWATCPGELFWPKFVHCLSSSSSLASVSLLVPLSLQFHLLLQNYSANFIKTRWGHKWGGGQISKRVT